MLGMRADAATSCRRARTPQVDHAAEFAGDRVAGDEAAAPGTGTSDTRGVMIGRQRITGRLTPAQTLEHTSNRAWQTIIDKLAEWEWP